MAKEQKEEPILASEFISALEAGDFSAELSDDEDCYPIVSSARLINSPGDACSIIFYYGYREDSPTYGISAGSHYFELMGVKLTADRDFYDTIVEDSESLFGREIEYDINPETDEPYTMEEVIEAIYENVAFKSFDADDYPCTMESLAEMDLWDIEIEPDNNDEPWEEDSKITYAIGPDGLVYFFDDDCPMPEGEGYAKIDREDAYEKMVETRQNADIDQL